MVYFEWLASVEKITRECSLPETRLISEADISKMIMAVMPRLMMDFPWPGKLRAAGDVATVESGMKYFQSLTEVEKSTEQGLLRTQIEKERLVTELTNLRDSRQSFVTQFKASLGLGASDPPPRAVSSALLATSGDQFLTMALSRNPRLKGMDADVKA